MIKIFNTVLILLCMGTASALPLTWRADWPDAKPVETLVHRGTDIELQPTWFINKAPADTNGWTYTTFCQTNAVGLWFGPLPGAFFSHTNDVGAAFYNVMVRAVTPGGAVNYTAFARLRMLDSPGFAPGELPLPVKVLDFANITVLNPPWSDVSADLTPATNYTDEVAAALSAAQTAALTAATNDVLAAANEYTRDTAVIPNGSGDIELDGGYFISKFDDDTVTQFEHDAIYGYDYSGTFYYRFMGGVDGYIATESWESLSRTLGEVTTDGESRAAFVSALATAGMAVSSNVYTKAETDEAIARHSSAPCPVASRSWNRPGEWTLGYAPIMAPQSSEFIDLFTDAVGIVFSNVTRTASRGLTAQIYSESLDLLGEDAPPALASIIVSDGGSASGDIVTVPTSGLYRVRGIAVTGAAREIAVSFAADAAKKTFESYYLADTNANRAAVNDYAAAALAGMGAVRTGTDSAGNDYTIYSTCLPGFGAKNGTGQFAPYAIAPKFAASAAHYPWVDCQNQTYTVNGDTFTVTRGGPVFNLGTWAATNGFTEAELRAGGAYDVAIIPLAEGKQFPAAACPYFATPEWIARNYISLRQLTVWTVSQTSEYGIPTVLTADGADGKLYYWLSAGGLQPGNPRPRFDLAALIGEYNERAWWRIQVGDSGKPVWFVDQSYGTARPILISHFEYETGGPNYTALARVVAALCAAFDTPCKLLQ